MAFHSTQRAFVDDDGGEKGEGRAVSGRRLKLNRRMVHGGGVGSSEPFWLLRINK